MINVLKAVIYGIVEGITEWLPISSTGHMILLNALFPMEVSEEFWSVFLVVIQLGAVLAVVVLYYDKLWPFGLRKRRRQGKSPVTIRTDILRLWGLIIVACLPAAIIGILFDDVFDKWFYNPVCVSIALIVFGVGFIFVESRGLGDRAFIRNIDDLDIKTVLIIGGFQLIAAIFPGTSRSGATILGALIFGVSRVVAAEFTFYLAVPVMAGASLLKIIKFLAGGTKFTVAEVSLLAVGMIVAFAVSIGVIRLFMNFIKRHDFRVFGVYRIALGILVLIVFGIRKIMGA